MTSDSSMPDNDAVDELARLWAVKMASDKAGELKESLEAWLSKSPRHREAYARARRNYLESAVLKSSSKFGLTQPRRQPAFSGRERPLLLAGISSALLIGIVMAQQFIPTNADEAQKSIVPSSMSAFAAEPLFTNRGEIRTFALEDGSSITLDSDSAAQIEFSKDIRTVRLEKGRARMEMAADTRPFLLRANAALIEGRKAVIDVDTFEPGKPSVVLLDGAARMSAADGSPGEPLTPAFSPVDIASRPHGQPNADSANARSDWTSGWAEHREIRLDALLLAANRYAKYPIEVTGERLAATPLTGRFHIAKTDEFLLHICALLNLQRHDLDERIILMED